MWNALRQVTSPQGGKETDVELGGAVLFKILQFPDVEGLGAERVQLS